MPSSGGSSRSSTSRGTWVLVWLLVLAGFALRAWFASWGLHHERFWDERYSFINIQAVYKLGDLRPFKSYYPSPVFNVPPAAVMRASEAYQAWTGDPEYRLFNADGLPTPATYLLCRLVQSVYGAAAIVFIFLAGRAMFSPQVGLLSALLVAFAPWPVHASAYIKPDSLLLMTIALSLYAMLSAIEKPTVLRYLLVGVAIALAMSAKLTGGMISIGLVVATAMMGWRDRRRWTLLVLAGATSALSFVLLNPYWQAYLGFLTGLKRDYILRAEIYGSTRLAMPGEVLKFITGEYLHGFVLGVLSLVGLAWLAVAAFRRGGKLSALERAKRGIMVIFPLIYTVVYIVQTPYFKANNFLPLVPFTSISIAWLLWSGFRRVAARWPVLGHPAAAAIAFLALFAWLASQGWLYAYRSYTPTTRDRAISWMTGQLSPHGARLVHLESWDAPKPRGGARSRLLNGLGTAKVTEGLAQLGAEELEWSDGVMFHEDRLTGKQAKFYQELITRVPPERVRSFRPEPFKRRGPSFVAVVFRLRRTEPFLELEPRPCGPEVSGGCLALDFPADADPHKAYNVFARLPSSVLGAARDAMDINASAVPRLELGEHSIEVLRASRQPKGHLFLTPRFRLDGSLREARLRREEPFGEGEMRIQLIEWTIN